MSELHPLYEMEDDIHGVRELLEAALLLFDDRFADGLKSGDAQIIHRLVRCADEKNAQLRAKWEKAFEAHKNERGGKCWSCDGPADHIKCGDCGAPAFAKKVDLAA